MEEEIKKALEARERAYCKSFKVGALLKMKSGKEYTGCNINNQGIQSICAERVAFSKAISEGDLDFDYIIVVGGSTRAQHLDKCLPCGYCRQFMSQFVDKDFKIYTYSNDGYGSGIIFAIFYGIITIVYSLIKFFILLITLLLEKFYIKPDYEKIYTDKKIITIETIAICLQIILFPIIFFIYLFALID